MRGKQSPEEMWLEALTYPPSPSRQEGQNLEKIFPVRVTGKTALALAKQASVSGASSLGSKHAQSFKAEGESSGSRQFEWERSPTLGDHVGPLHSSAAQSKPGNWAGRALCRRSFQLGITGRDRCPRESKTWESLGGDDTVAGEAGKRHENHRNGKTLS